MARDTQPLERIIEDTRCAGKLSLGSQADPHSSPYLLLTACGTFLVLSSPAEQLFQLSAYKVSNNVQYTASSEVVADVSFFLCCYYQGTDSGIWAGRA